MSNRKKYLIYFSLTIFSTAILLLIIKFIAVSTSNRNTSRAIESYLSSANISNLNTDSMAFIIGRDDSFGFKVGKKRTSIEIYYFPLGYGLRQRTHYRS
jgi:hypothetical protein